MSGPIEVNIDRDQVNKFVADKILESTLGDHIKEAVKKMVNSSEYGKNTPVEDAIKTEIRNITIQVVQKEWREKIREKIAEKLTVEITDSIVNRAIEKLLNTY